jgi:RNA polymerase sigma factor (sigma-70 family)
MEDTTAVVHGVDGAEWNALIGPYLPRLKRFAERRLPAEMRRTIGAEDLVQEAVISGIKHLDRFEFRHQQAFFAYLLTSIRHRIVDEVRRTSCRPVFVPLLEREVVDPTVSPLQRVIARENMERYGKAVALLGKRDRQLIALRLDEGLSYRDIAARLGVRTEMAVRMAIKRALHRLQSRLR